MADVLKYNDSDVDYLARLMRAEALGEGEYGMLCVGNVLVNRVMCASPDFRSLDSVQDAIFQTPGGFSGINSNLFKTESTPEEKALAIRVLEGEKFWPASRALWFYAPKKGEDCRSTWFNQKNVGKYKNHCFYVPEAGQCEE